MAVVINFQLSMPDARPEENQLRQSMLTATVQTLQHVFSQATPEDLRRVNQMLTDAAKTDKAERNPARQALLARLSDGQMFSAPERVALEADNMERLFAVRRAVLSDALTAPDAARLLGTSRQTPYDRAKRGTLLAVSDNGALRFPRWQFDPQGPGGVVTGLPTVLKALRVSPLEQALWLTRPALVFEGRTPLQALQAGETARVLGAASAVGVA